MSQCDWLAGCVCQMVPVCVFVYYVWLITVIANTLEQQNSRSANLFLTFADVDFLPLAFNWWASINNPHSPVKTEGRWFICYMKGVQVMEDGLLRGLKKSSIITFNDKVQETFREGLPLGILPTLPLFLKGNPFDYWKILCLGYSNNECCSMGAFLVCSKGFCKKQKITFCITWPNRNLTEAFDIQCHPFIC